MKGERYEITHAVSGSFLAVRSGSSPEEAKSALIAEPGYGYLTPDVLSCRLLPPVQRFDCGGNPIRSRATR